MEGLGECSDLKWTGGFDYPGMVRIRTGEDGSCFFHAILQCFFQPYRSEMLDGKPISRSQITTNFRQDLADSLSKPADGISGPTHYDKLANGRLRSYVEDNMPEYTIENMEKELRSRSAVGQLYHEYLSEMVRKDIYILDGHLQDITIYGPDAEKLLYKNRESIVLLFKDGHYESVGVKENGIIITHFKVTNEFIKFIQDRKRVLFASRIKN